LAFDAFAHTDHHIYLQSGLEHARFVAGIARESAPPKRLRILEWGCGPARIIRHLPELLADRLDVVVGADFNPKTIAWCTHNLPGIRFERNGLEPPLPFPDRSFDFIYAISVFTHLDEVGWTGWLREMSRILDDAGVLLFTTHGVNYLPKLLAGERAVFDSGRPVFRTNVAQGKRLFVAFHPRDFVLRSLEPGLDVLTLPESADPPALSQDVWVVRKNPMRPEFP